MPGTTTYWSQTLGLLMACVLGVAGTDNDTYPESSGSLPHFENSSSLEKQDLTEIATSSLSWQDIGHFAATGMPSMHTGGGEIGDIFMYLTLAIAPSLTVLGIITNTIAVIVFTRRQFCLSSVFCYMRALAAVDLINVMLCGVKMAEILCGWFTGKGFLPMLTSLTSMTSRFLRFSEGAMTVASSWLLVTILTHQSIQAARREPTLWPTGSWVGAAFLSLFIVGASGGLQCYQLFTDDLSLGLDNCSSVGLASGPVYSTVSLLWCDAALLCACPILLCFFLLPFACRWRSQTNDDVMQLFRVPAVTLVLLVVMTTLCLSPAGGLSVYCLSSSLVTSLSIAPHQQIIMQLQLLFSLLLLSAPALRPALYLASWGAYRRAASCGGDGTGRAVMRADSLDEPSAPDVLVARQRGPAPGPTKLRLLSLRSEMSSEEALVEATW